MQPPDSLCRSVACHVRPFLILSTGNTWLYFSFFTIDLILLFPDTAIRLLHWHYGTSTVIFSFSLLAPRHAPLYHSSPFSPSPFLITFSRLLFLLFQNTLDTTARRDAHNASLLSFSSSPALFLLLLALSHYLDGRVFTRGVKGNRFTAGFFYFFYDRTRTLHPFLYWLSLAGTLCPPLILNTIYAHDVQTFSIWIWVWRILYLYIHSISMHRAFLSMNLPPHSSMRRASININHTMYLTILTI
ncbi:hypothetical protein BJX76DRAFT_293510 [Aspergillus varians]